MSVVPPKAGVNDGPKFCVRRIVEPYNGDFTRGQVYEVKDADTAMAYVLTNNGNKFQVGRYGAILFENRWQFFWLLPDGTELEALK